MFTPESLINWLAAMTLRGSILIGVVLMLQLVLRPWMSARWRWALWLPALLALALPTLPQCGWSLEASWRPSPMNAEWCCPSVELPWEQAGNEAASSHGGYSWNGAAGVGWWIIALCWAAGAMWFLGVVGWSYRRTWRRLQNGATTMHADARDILAEAARGMRLRRMPRVLVSPHIASPAVTGLLRPTLLLPTHFPGELTTHEARLVLAHELLHIRRGDLWTTWLLCVLQAIHWFNPVVWLAFTRMRSDCEQACDEGVLDRGSMDDVMPYGHALIKVGSGAEESSVPLGVLTVATPATVLGQRICRVARYQRRPVGWSMMWLAVIGVVTVLGATRSPEWQPGDFSALAGEPECGVDRSREIILPVVRLSDATIEEAVEYLQTQSRVADEAGHGVKILLTPQGLESSRNARVSLDLQGVSVWEAFAAISQQADLGLDGNAYLLCLLHPPAPAR